MRFQPALPWRLHASAPFERHPALVAAVTDDAGRIAGVHRNWLDPAGGKAKLVEPRRSLGHILGNAVRFPALDPTGDAATLVAGEGIETVLSLRDILPTASLAACLSAGHLAAFRPPPGIRHLFIARDNGKAGRRAARRLLDCMRAHGLTVTILRPVLADFNADRQQFGVAQFRERLAKVIT